MCLLYITETLIFFNGKRTLLTFVSSLSLFQTNPDSEEEIQDEEESGDDFAIQEQHQNNTHSSLNPAQLAQMAHPSTNPLAQLNAATLMSSQFLAKLSNIEVSVKSLFIYTRLTDASRYR